MRSQKRELGLENPEHSESLSIRRDARVGLVECEGEARSEGNRMICRWNSEYDCATLPLMFFHSFDDFPFG